MGKCYSPRSHLVRSPATFSRGTHLAGDFLHHGNGNSSLSPLLPAWGRKAGPASCSSPLGPCLLVFPHMVLSHWLPPPTRQAVSLYDSKSAARLTHKQARESCSQSRLSSLPGREQEGERRTGKALLGESHSLLLRLGVGGCREGILS